MTLMLSYVSLGVSWQRDTPVYPSSTIATQPYPTLPYTILAHHSYPQSLAVSFTTELFIKSCRWRGLCVSPKS